MAFQTLDDRTEEPVVTPVVERDLKAQRVFEGREQELAELAEALRPGSGVGIVAISGLAGVGKTALATRAAQTAMAAGWFAGGVLTVDMRGHRHVPPSAALASLLGSVGFESAEIPPDLAGQERLWRSVLAKRAAAGKSTLLVLDNVSNSDDVVPLLPGSDCPQHRVVVTSRNSLSALQGARLMDLQVLSDRQASDLLTADIAASRKDDPRTTEDRDAALEVARLCGGLPLAIRICAALLLSEPDRSLRDLVADLRDERHRLEELAFDGSLAVRAAFDLSLETLTAQQRRVFRLLALNPAPVVSTEAAAALSAIEIPSVRRVIRQLLRAHLIMPADGRDRWKMHDLVRLYAVRLNTTEDDEEKAIARLLEYYRDMASSAGDYIDTRIPPPAVDGRFTDREDALDWLEREYPSLVGAVGLASRSNRHRDAYELASALNQFYELGKHWQAWLHISTIAVTAARHLGDRRMTRQALTQLGNASRALGHLDDALAHHREALAISRETHDQAAEGHCLTTLANAYLALGDTAEAVSCNEKSLSIRTALHDLYGQRITLNHLGNAHLQAGRLDTAVRCYENALQINTELDDPHGESRTLTNLGAAYQQQGKLEQALACFGRDLSVVRGLRDRYGEATTLLNLGIAHLKLSDVAEAEECLSQAAAIFGDLGSRRGIDAEAQLNAIRRAKRQVITTTAESGSLSESNPSTAAIVPPEPEGIHFHHLYTTECSGGIPASP